MTLHGIEWLVMWSHNTCPPECKPSSWMTVDCAAMASKRDTALRAAQLLEEDYNSLYDETVRVNLIELLK